MPVPTCRGTLVIRQEHMDRCGDGFVCNAIRTDRFFVMPIADICRSY
jgi:hypothetical protein